NIKGPLPQARMMPTGGVNAGNVADWISAGAVAVGAGGDLTAGAKTGDYDSIIKIGKEMVDAVAAARKK
ncbi:MAG: bifunctional 2-keto-4-hydroxyglutarate aldolase/2-keto-3-deoxy-6-phosphogluconate aldolase, partial [Christensenellaceae bacterium]